MHDGILESGVVSESREPRPKCTWSYSGSLKAPAVYAVEPRPSILPLRRIPWATRSALLPFRSARHLPQTLEHGKRLSSDGKYWPTVHADDQWARSGSKFELWRQTRKTRFCWRVLRSIQRSWTSTFGHSSPVGLRTGHSHPATLLAAPCSGKHFIAAGYPLAGKAGEVAAIYELRFSSGKVMEIPLRWGLKCPGQYDSRWHAHSAVAVQAQAAIEYIKDVAASSIKSCSTPRPGLNQE